MRERVSTGTPGAGRRIGEPSGDIDAQFARRHAAADLARESGVVRVNGSSMMPALAESSWVRFSERRPRSGDMVVFRRQTGELVVHRFLGLRPLRWGSGPETPGDGPLIVTKPDAAAEFDVEVRTSALLGTVDALRRESSEPWREVEITRLRRVGSTMWFLRYILRRVIRRLAR